MLDKASVDTRVTGTIYSMLHQGKGHATAAEPVLEIIADGTTIWTVDGVLHREDGPALEGVDGSKEWFRHGALHREDGPAVEWFDGAKEWFLHGRPYPKPAWLREVLKDRALTTHQRELLSALSENWDGTPDLLYETVTHLAG